MQVKANPLARLSQDGKIAIVLFLIAFLIRLPGIHCGLPSLDRHYSLHPDEFQNYTVSRRIEPLQGKFAPGFYNYGTLYFTTLRVASDILVGQAPPPSDVEAQLKFISACDLVGRAISALCAACLVALVFLMARRFTNLFGAIVGAAATCFSPGLLQHSLFQTPDAMAALLTFASLYWSLKILDGADGARKATLIAGALAGLSCGTKYTGILAMAPLLVCLVVAQKREIVKSAGSEFATALLVCLAAFVIATPGAILDQKTFKENFGFEWSHTKTGHGLVFMETSPGWIFQLANLFSGFGLLLTVMGGAGLLVAAYRMRAWALATLALAACMYVVIGGSEVKFFRYAMPLIPLLSLGVAWLSGGGHARGGAWKAIAALGLLALGGIESGGLRGFLTSLANMAGPDPRDVAAQALKLEKGTVGFVSDPWFYSPPIFPGVGMPRGQYSKLAILMSVSSPKVVQFVPANPDERFDWDSRLVTDLKPARIVYSSFEADAPERFVQVGASEGVPALIAGRYKKFAEALRANYDLEHVYGEPGPRLVEDLMYTAPTVWVWKRKQTP